MEITVDKLNVIDGNYTILDDLNLHVKNRNFIGIIGPNGSGKSTLLKAISRSIRSESNEISYDGRDINHLSYKESAKLISCLDQEHDMPFDFQARELIMMGRYPYKKMFETENQQDERIVDSAIDQVDIRHLQYKNYQHLSGGEKQRVLIARMIAQQSDIFILDEPTNHLDISYQLELFKFLHETPTTVISAIHDLNIAARFCDYLFVMKDGKIFCQGEPQEILTSRTIAEVFNVDVDVVKHPTKSQLVIIY